MNTPIWRPQNDGSWNAEANGKVIKKIPQSQIITPDGKPMQVFKEYKVKALKEFKCDRKKIKVGDIVTATLFPPGYIYMSLGMTAFVLDAQYQIDFEFV
jgi:hypothetical protein